MADEEREVTGYEWLLEPPTEGTMHVHIEVPEGASLSPELRGAIDELIRQLGQEAAEVEGQVLSGPIVVRPKPQCTPRTVTPCAKFVTCRIVGA